MRRYRFGEGEYKYFDAPLPEVIDGGRHALYRRWPSWPTMVAAPARARDLPGRPRRFLDRCHRAASAARRR
jgi:hypothetical protein